MWSILADAPWQHRLPAAMVACALLISFAGIWDDESWSALIACTVVAVAAACLLLRWRGFRMHREFAPANTASIAAMQVHQFGTRQLLIWAAAMAPLLLVAKQIDYLYYFAILRHGVLHATVASAGIAIVAVVAAWATLGRTFWLLRILAIVAITAMIGIGIKAYANLMIVPLGRGISWPKSALASCVSRLQTNAYSWFMLFAMMTAALLLFLRARGYRLDRR
jgi:hypothetical protein